MLTAANNDHILTTHETAAYLKLSRVTIYRMAKKGEIPCRKVGAQYRFVRTVLDAWLVEGTLSADAADAILHAMPVAMER